MFTIRLLFKCAHLACVATIMNRNKIDQIMKLYANTCRSGLWSHAFAYLLSARRCYNKEEWDSRGTTM